MVANSIINLLGEGLDGALSRHKYLSNNIANVDTPNYKRKDLNFITTLRNKVQCRDKLSLSTTDQKHIKASSTSSTGFNKGIFLNQRTSYRNDNNNVDIDIEMAEQTKNALYYNTLTRQISDRFSILKDVISKGGR